MVVTYGLDPEYVNGVLTDIYESVDFSVIEDFIGYIYKAVTIIFIYANEKYTVYAVFYDDYVSASYDTLTDAIVALYQFLVYKYMPANPTPEELGSCVDFIDSVEDQANLSVLRWEILKNEHYDWYVIKALQILQCVVMSYTAKTSFYRHYNSAAGYDGGGALVTKSEQPLENGLYRYNIDIWVKSPANENERISCFFDTTDEIIVRALENLLKGEFDTSEGTNDTCWGMRLLFNLINRTMVDYFNKSINDDANGNWKTDIIPQTSNAWKEVLGPDHEDFMTDEFVMRTVVDGYYYFISIEDDWPEDIHPPSPVDSDTTGTDTTIDTDTTIIDSDTTIETDTTIVDSDTYYDSDTGLWYKDIMNASMVIVPKDLEFLDLTSTITVESEEEVIDFHDKVNMGEILGKVTIENYTKLVKDILGVLKFEW